MLMIVTAGAVWGTIGLFVRNLSAAGLQSMEIAAIRCTVTCVVMLALLAIVNPKLLKVRLRDVWCFLGTGICSIVLFTWCYFTCMTLSSLSVAAVLLYTAPIFVMLMAAVFFRERITRVKVIALVCAFAGCVLVSGVGGNVTPLAVITGLGAGFGYALYSIFGTFALRRYATLTVIAYTFLIASIGCVLLCDLGAIGAYVQAAPLPNIAYMILFGVVSCVIPYLLYTKGLEKVEAGKASILASVEPVVATLVGVIVFREALTVSNACGVLLVLTAIVLLNLKFKKANA